MPIKPENKHRYPANWKDIRRIVLEAAEHRCMFCYAENYKPHPITGSKVVLTIAHLDQQPENNSADNLRALCQKCHLSWDRAYRKRSEAWKDIAERLGSDISKVEKQDAELDVITGKRFEEDEEHDD